MVVVAPSAERSNLRRALLLTWGMLGLCLAVPILVWQVTAHSLSVVPGWWLPEIFLVWSGAHLSLLIAKGQPKLPEFSTWLFIYVFMGLAPALQLRTGIFPSTTSGVPEELADTAALIILVSLICMELGLWWARQATRSAQRPLRRIDEKRAVLLAYAGIVLSSYYVASIGISSLFATRNELATIRSQVWPDNSTQVVINVAAYIPLLVAVHALIRARRVTIAEGGRGRNRILTGLCLALLLLIINPISSPRYVFGTVILSLVFLAGAFSSPGRVRITLLGITAALVFVFPYADVFRTPEGGSNEAGLVANLTSNGDYDAFAQMVNTVGYVESNGVTMGRQALGVVLFWVPREMWDDKPTDTGILLADYKGYNFTNLSAPIWSEMYINAGWLGVVLGSVLLGFFVGRGGERIAEHDRNNTPAAVGLGILSFYLLLLLRGSLLQAMLTLSVLMMCTLVVRERRSAQAQAQVQARDRESARARVAAA